MTPGSSIVVIVIFLPYIPATIILGWTKNPAQLGLNYEPQRVMSCCLHWFCRTLVQCFFFFPGAFSIACHFHRELNLSHAPGHDSSDDEEEGGEEAAVRAPFKKKKNLSSTSFFEVRTAGFQETTLPETSIAMENPPF